MTLEERCIETVGRACPELAGAPAAVNSEGQNNLVLMVGGWVFRFPRYPAGIAALARESAILRAVAPLVGLAVPTPQIERLDEQTVGAAFAAYRAIPGAPLWRETLRDLPAPATERVAAQLGAFLSALHAIPLAALPPGLAVADLPAEWADIHRRISAGLFPRMRPAARREITALFAGYFSQAERFRFAPALRHGDFGGGNLLFDATSQALSGVLDFGHTGPGDPACDLAGLLGYGEPFVELLARAYPGLEALLERARFYRATFALLEALFGLEHGDDAALASGLADYL